jgi:hypothetical protein
MSKLILILILVFSGFAARAEIFAGAGVQTRLLQDEESIWKLKFPLTIFGGYEFKPWAVFGEGQYFKQSDSSGSILNVSVDHYEFTAYGLKFFSFEDGRVVNPYLIGGLGVMQEKVKTTFAGSSETDKSQLYMTIKAGGGLWMQFLSRGFCMVEGKMMYSNPYSPDLIFALDLRAGYTF